MQKIVDEYQPPPVYNGLNQLYFLEINNLEFKDYCKPEITVMYFPNNISAR